LIAAAIARHFVPGEVNDHWRNNPYRPVRERFKAEGSEYTVWLTPAGQGRFQVKLDERDHAVQLWSWADGEMGLSVDGHRLPVTILTDDGKRWWYHLPGQSGSLDWLSPLPEGGQRGAAEGSLHAPMPGQVRAVQVIVGQRVEVGDTLMILEAMKMEHRIKAPYAGEVLAVHFQVGQQAPVDAVLLEIKPQTG
jgi:acetyl/propionyl-CoA carboxylase alpha subunit